MDNNATRLRQTISQQNDAWRVPSLLLFMTFFLYSPGITNFCSIRTKLFPWVRGF